MASQDNEKAMDGLLRRSLARDASSKDECPNAELLAAYYERSLGADEIAAYDLHFSQCSRCREQLAAMVRAGTEIEVEKEHALEPALVSARAMEARPAAATVAPRASNQPQLRPQAHARPRRSLIELRWLLPVAAALVLTALVYVRLAPHQPQVASIRELEAPPQPVPPRLDPNAFNVFPNSAVPASASSPAKKAPRSSSDKPAAGEPASAPARSHTSGAVSARAGSASAPRSAASAPVGRATPPPVFRSPDAPPIYETPADRVVSRKELPTEPAPAVTPSEPKQSLATSATAMDSAQAIASPPPPADSNRKSESVEGTRPSFLHFGASNTLTKSKTTRERAAEIVIHSPDPRVLYRIASGGFIERSDDAGATWLGELLNATAEFTAGSAPAPQICWLVGRAGIIYRTDDGKNWKKIPSPAVSDFTAVAAKSASSATVTTPDGKRWSTDDAGETWSPAK